MLGSPDDGPMSQSLGGFPGFEFSQTTGFDRIGSHGATCASAAVTQPRISAANPTPTTAANRHAPSAHQRSMKIGSARGWRDAQKRRPILFLRVRKRSDIRAVGAKV